MGQVLFVVVAVEGLLERGLCFASLSCLGKYFGQVAVGVALQVECVCLLDDRDRLVRELLGLTVFAAVCVDARLNLLPKRLGGQVLLGREFAPKLRPRLGLFVASEFAERTTELGTRRWRDKPC